MHEVVGGWAEAYIECGKMRNVRQHMEANLLISVF